MRKLFERTAFATPRLTDAFFHLRTVFEVTILPLNAYKEEPSMQFISSTQNNAMLKFD